MSTMYSNHLIFSYNIYITAIRSESVIIKLIFLRINKLFHEYLIIEDVS